MQVFGRGIFEAEGRDAGGWPTDETRIIAINEGRLVDFGVYADVETPGHVRVGDAVELL